MWPRTGSNPPDINRFPSVTRNYMHLQKQYLPILLKDRLTGTYKAWTQKKRNYELTNK